MTVTQDVDGKPNGADRAGVPTSAGRTAQSPEPSRLADLDIHELRHTATALMIRAGADPKLIQTQLGHSSVAITYDVYGHLFLDRLEALGEDLDRPVRRAQAGTGRDRPTTKQDRGVGL